MIYRWKSLYFVKWWWLLRGFLTVIIPLNSFVINIKQCNVSQILKTRLSQSLWTTKPKNLFTILTNLVQYAKLRVLIFLINCASSLLLANCVNIQNSSYLIFYALSIFYVATIFEICNFSLIGYNCDSFFYSIKRWSQSKWL